MTPVIVGAVAGLLVLLAAQGIRMLATTGLETAVPQDPVVAASRSRGLYAMVDGVGQRFERAAHGFYSTERLAALDALVRAAGRPEGLTQVKYVQRHTGFVVLGFVLFVLLVINGQVAAGVIIWLIFAIWMPLWIRLAARDRRVRIERDLPDFLDVLAVTVKAGMSFRPALARVREHHGGPLRDEIGVTLDEMELGVSRRAAFTALRDRTATDGMATFVTALLQAEELGVPLADALTGIAAELRRERAQSVKQQAAKASSKVSLVTTLTILPGALILVVAVMLMQNLDALSGVFG